MQSSEVVQLLTTLAIQVPQAGIHYESNVEGGYQGEYHDGKLVNLYLFNRHDKKYKQYQGQLPYGIQFEMSNEDIVSKFGEPSLKQGGKCVNIGLSYNRLGIEIVFMSRHWEDHNVPIDQIILYEPVNDQPTCGVCKQPADLRCSQCKLLYYCGQSCQKLHWKAHKTQCIQII